MEPFPKAAVIGALNLDLIIQGLPHFADPGEQVNGESLLVSPGGKGRNIASMLAAWMGPGEVNMAGKLPVDRRGLYRIPLESLADAGVRTDVILLERERPDDLPTFSIFLNTQNGQRASYYLPGRNESLTREDIDTFQPLFVQLAENRGILLLTLEMPVETAAYALKIASSLGLRVMLDPGGQPPEKEIDFSPLFTHPLDVIKPNALEAERLTGVKVSDFKSAEQAAAIFSKWGAQQVLITHGEQGAYGFSGSEGFHVPAPNLPLPRDGESTGCGDQVLAVLCAEVLHGKPFRAACEKAVLAGSLQYRQSSQAPIRPDNPHFKW